MCLCTQYKFIYYMCYNVCTFQVGCHEEKLKYTEDHMNRNLELQDEVHIHSMASIIVARFCLFKLFPTTNLKFSYPGLYVPRLVCDGYIPML